MSTLLGVLRDRITQAAQALGLPLGWEGEPFVVPGGPHMRARIVIEDTRTASLGTNGLTRSSGYSEMRIVTPVGKDMQAMTLAAEARMHVSRGTILSFATGECTLMTPAVSAPVHNGKHCIVVIRSNFYAHSQ